MSASDTREAPPSLADRLRDVRVGLRGDLEVSRHVFRGKVAYVVRDPISFQNHSFSKDDYRILVAFDKSKKLADIFDELVEKDIITHEDEEAFYGFILRLHSLGFLRLPILNDQALYRRHKARISAKRKQLIMSPIFFRIPLFNPNAFLDRTVRFARVLFTPWAFAAWLGLVATAAWVAVGNAEELAQPLNSVLAAGNLMLMWMTLVVLKLLHEFGHAFACKSFGGHVPEMGLMMIAGTPCAYVDATAAWGFTRKRHRLIVSLAGIYVELAIASVAILVWTTSTSPLLSSISYNVALLASVVTIAFNINPLMRYDGYYVLSDLLEIPNLRSKSTKYVTTLAKRLALGIKPTGEHHSLRLKIILTSYGISSSIYRFFVVMGISALIASKVFLLGMALGACYALNELVRLVRRLGGYLLKSRETRPIRTRAITVAVIIFIAIPAAMLLVPIPGRVRANGVLGSANETIVRASMGGFIRQVAVQPGMVVPPGALLGHMENPDAQSSLATAEARYESAETKLHAWSAVDSLHARRQRQIVKWRRDELETRRAELAGLTVLAPAGGRIVNSLTPSDIGRFVPTGEKLALIISGRKVVRTMLTEQELIEARPVVGQSVKFRGVGDAGAIYRGHIVRVAPTGVRKITRIQLTQLGGGDIAVHPVTLNARDPRFEITIELEDGASSDLRYGMTGQILMDSSWETPGAIVLRKLLRFVDRLHRG